MIFSKKNNQLNKTVLYFSISTCFFAYNLMAGTAVQNDVVSKVMDEKPLNQEMNLHAGALIVTVASSDGRTESRGTEKKSDAHKSENHLQVGDVLTGIYVGSKFFPIRSSEEHYATLQNLDENGITKGSIYYVYRRNGEETLSKINIEKVGANNFDGLTSSNFTVENAFQKVQEIIYSRKPKEVSDDAVVAKNIFGLLLKSLRDKTIHNFDSFCYAQNHKLADDVIVNFAFTIDSLLALVEDRINAVNVADFLGYVEEQSSSQVSNTNKKKSASSTGLFDLYKGLVTNYNSLVAEESQKINLSSAGSFSTLGEALQSFNVLGAKIVTLRAQIKRKNVPLYYTYRDASEIQKILLIDRAFLRLSVIVKTLDVLKGKVDASAKANQAYQSDRSNVVKALNLATQNDVLFLKDLKNHFESMKKSSLYGYCHTSLRPTGFFVRSLTPGSIAQQLDLRLNDIVKSISVVGARDKKQTNFLVSDILSKRFVDKAQGLFKRDDQVSAEVMRLSGSEPNPQKVQVGPVILTDDILLPSVGIDFYNWSENLCAITHSGITRFASQKAGSETPQDYMNKRFPEIVSLLLSCVQQTEAQEFSKLLGSRCEVSKWSWNNGRIHVSTDLLNILNALETVLMPPRVRSSGADNHEVPKPIFADADVQDVLRQLLRKDTDEMGVKKFISMDELKAFLLNNWTAVSSVLSNPQEFDKIKSQKEKMIVFRQAMIKMIAAHKIYSVLKTDKVMVQGMPLEVDLFIALDKILSTFSGNDLEVKPEVETAKAQKEKAEEVKAKEEHSQDKLKDQAAPAAVVNPVNSDETDSKVKEAVKKKVVKPVGSEEKLIANADESGEKVQNQHENKLAEKTASESIDNKNQVKNAGSKSDVEEPLAPQKEKAKKAEAKPKTVDPVESSSDVAPDSLVPPYDDGSSSEMNNMKDDLKEMQDMKDSLGKLANKVLEDN